MRSFSSLPTLAAIGSATLFWAQSAAAQNLQIIVDGIPGCDFANGRHTPQCIPQFIGHVVVVVFQAISALFLLNVLYAGYQIAMGAWQGEKSAGKDRLTWSIIGLIVSVSAFTILDLALTVIAPDA